MIVGRLPRQGTPWDRAIVAPVEALWWVHGLSTGHRANDALLAAAPDHDGAEEGHEEAHAGTEADRGRVDLQAFRIGPPWDAEAIAGVPAIVVKPKSVGDAYRLRGRFRTASSMALFPAEVLVELYGLLGDARAVLAWIAVATQALVIAAILLAVFATIALRRKPLAVLRALGASRPYLFLVVWVHVSGMILAGAGLGLALGWAGAAALSHLFSLKTGIQLPVSLGRPEILMVLALVGAGFLLAAIPSWSSYRQPVSSALRS